MATDLTIGIEEEFQIIDPATRELRCVVAKLVESSTPLDQVELQHELHLSTVEVATGICKNIHEARRDVAKNRRAVASIAERSGMAIGAASTHPFANWEEQQTNEAQRYHKLVVELQDIARANLIFGMHVHVGIADPEESIAVFNSARYFLPHLLALSTSSPFFNGRKTGLMSSRTLIFQRLPRTGIPERFGSYSAYESYLETLVATGCVDDHRRIWWDVRPHPTFSTLEFRICDLPTRLDDVVTIAALVQALTAKLLKLHRENLSFAIHRTALMNENKWRAARYGVTGNLIDFGKRKAVPFKNLGHELLEFVDDVVDELGSRRECEGIERILSQGTSADRQLDVYEKSGGRFEAVVDHVLEETMTDIENGAPGAG